jgi:hypothetical protein
MARYKMVQLKEKKALAQELENTLNEHATRAGHSSRWKGPIGAPVSSSCWFSGKTKADSGQRAFRGWNWHYRVLPLILLVFSPPGIGT